MNICKYCKKWKICSFMTILALILKHIVFFIKAVIEIVFKENILLNITVIILYIITALYLSKFINVELLYGAYLGILITANLQLTAEKYRKEILWDGDWKILENDKYNFEHKKDIYICLCGCLSDIVGMIVNYNQEPYQDGRLMSVEHFDDAARRYRLWRFENFHPNFNSIDEINSYNTFERFVRAFRRINTIISSIQNLQTHINSYCPKFNVKSTIGLLLNELFISAKFVQDLQVFIENSSPDDDAIMWQVRLRILLEQRQINIDALNNNIRNLVIHLSLMYNDINNDFDFRKEQGS